MICKNCGHDQNEHIAHFGKCWHLGGCACPAFVAPPTEPEPAETGDSVVVDGLTYQRRDGLWWQTDLTQNSGDYSLPLFACGMLDEIVRLRSASPARGEEHPDITFAQAIRHQINYGQGYAIAVHDSDEAGNFERLLTGEEADAWLLEQLPRLPLSAREAPDAD